ncbi:MAG: hypothetical protein ACON5H_08225 [Akkermansiaceae bacterium]
MNAIGIQELVLLITMTVLAGGPLGALKILLVFAVFGFGVM